MNMNSYIVNCVIYTIIYEFFTWMSQIHVANYMD